MFLGRGLKIIVEKSLNSLALSSAEAANLKFSPILETETNDDGRVAKDDIPRLAAPGVYRVSFLTGLYFENSGQEVFYPIAQIVFKAKSNQHYHIPLLLSPFGYNTYRGS